ncbi:ABC-2 type transport system permease protein [Amycolatopsis bartoniae]|uniref:Transport permease protein n=1 Tax=Amycolatopsis bartoniae TaxID=941986 RepID=A0A8H9MDD1_9PSEU|nr:ABC transporter permease [Amycolatopsis bartoniae]MBB2936422.1 ABC-2 type transport system permease protein [Amycolatopsis bartoniae]GHF69045.1 transport permease protein [Amycolatopsis bartoniae]
MSTVLPRPGAWSASLVFATRALLKLKHRPEQLIDVTIFPVIMTLMFTYLLGSTLAASPADYLQFLLPGVLVMSVVMITPNTGVGINVDVEKGLFDRIRTLAVWRPSALVGALLGDLVRYVLASTVILVVGLVLGFRPPGGVLGVLAGVVLVLVFAFAFSWIWTLAGLVLRTQKSVMSVSVLVLFPFTFLSNVFVEPKNPPAWLRMFMRFDPIAHLVTAVRGLMRGVWNGPEIGWTLLSAVLLLAVFGTLSMWRYNRR